MAFETRSPDGRSERQIVLDLVRERAMKPGDLLTYDELHEALSRDESERHAVRQAVQDAAARLLLEDQRTLVAVARRGYRMAAASEHMRLADSRRRRAGNQIRIGTDIVEHVRSNELTEAERTTSVKMHIAFRQIAAVVDSERRRNDEQDAAIADVRSQLRVVQRKVGIRPPRTIDHETSETG